MRLLSAFLSGLLLVSLAAASPRASAPVTLRVLTYNIRHGEGRDDRIDLVRTAGVIRDARPDLVALQEVDRWTERVGGVDQVAELARLLDMHATFGKTLDYAGGEYGLAVLSRWPLEGAEVRSLPFSEDREPRGALTVRVQVGEGGPWLLFTNTHLDQSREPSDGALQADVLNRLLARPEEPPSLLAGDFNARPGTDVMRILEVHWANALPDDPPARFGVSTPLEAAPSRPPRRGPRGDFVLYRPARRWRVLESRSIDETVASDHRPVLVVLELVGDGEG